MAGTKAIAGRRLLWRYTRCFASDGYVQGMASEIDGFVLGQQHDWAMSPRGVSSTLGLRFFSTSAHPRPSGEENGGNKGDDRRADDRERQPSQAWWRRTASSWSIRKLFARSTIYPQKDPVKVTFRWSLEELFTLPNTISLSRLALGPVLAWAIVEGHTTPAFWGLLAGGLSDWLDGYVAKRTKAKTVLGSYLDPLADKVFIGCVALSMVHANLLYPPLVMLIVARDTTLVAGSLYERARSLNWKWSSWEEFFDLNDAPKLQPIFSSKLNTALQFALVSVSLIGPNSVDAFFLSCGVAFTTVFSWVSYFELYLRKRYK